MKASEKYQYWVMLSDYDLETARVLIDGKRWLYVAYMCHQALERQIRGMYVYYVDREAPKSHNLPFLFDRLRSCPAFPEIGTMEQETGNRYEDFFTEIMFYYMSEYPFSYKRIGSRLIDEDTGRKLFEQVNRCIDELRTYQPLPDTAALSPEQMNE